LVFLGNTDTVQPSENARYDQLGAGIHNGKIWGRGTTDMKSGIAAMLQALSLTPDAQNTWMFLYADEEYDFLGMKALVSEYSDIRPELMVSSDGSDLKLGHGCRGLIEFRARVTGETGHPARGTGNSAVWGSVEGLKELTEYLEKYKHPIMGEPLLIWLTFLVELYYPIQSRRMADWQELGKPEM
jgi:acetylornithine deacetylase/succinyl-diaminopimelate desuccinylase-like protein